MTNANTVTIRINADGTAAISGMKHTVDGVEKEATRAGKSVDLLGNAASSAAGMLKILAVTVAGLELKRLIVDSTLLASRVETLGTVMPVVGNNAEYTAAQMNSYAQGVAKMGITTEESRQTVLRMAGAHMDLAKSQELARIAQDAAVIANTNSSEALQRLIYGIVSRQPEMLRTMELNVDFEKSYKSMANQLGKTTEQLTEHEKIQVATNAVIAKGKDIAGTYEAAMGTTGKQVSSLKRYHDELKLSIGEAFSPAFGAVVSGYTDALKDLMSWAENNKSALKEFGQDLKGIATAFMHPLDSLTNLAMAPFKDMDEADRQAEIDAAYQKTIETIKKRQEAKRIAAAEENRHAQEQAEQRRINEAEQEKEISRYNQFVDAFNSRIRAIEQSDTALTEHEREIMKIRGEYELLIEQYPKEKASIKQLEAYHLQEVTRRQEQAAAIKATSDAFKEYLRLAEEEPPQHNRTGEMNLRWENELASLASLQPSAGTDALNEQISTFQKLLLDIPEKKKEVEASIAKLQAGYDASSGMTGLRNDLAMSGQDPFTAQTTQREQQYAEQLRIADNYYAAKAGKEQEHAALIEQIQQNHAAKMKQVEGDRWKAAAGTVASYMGQMAQELMQGNKEQFEIGKRMAQATAAIQGALAIIQSYGQLGPIAGSVAAALIGAVTLQQIAKIDSQEYQATRALGGSVEAGRSYLVGERGRELFTPAENGSITPNNRLGNGGQQVSVTNVWQVSTGVAATVQAELQRFAPAFQQMAVSAVMQAMRNGDFQEAA